MLQQGMEEGGLGYPSASDQSGAGILMAVTVFHKSLYLVPRCSALSKYLSGLDLLLLRAPSPRTDAAKAALGRQLEALEAGSVFRKPFVAHVR